MLHRLEIQNFYSIRDLQVIDLRATAHSPDDTKRLAPLWIGSSERAPKVVALFGANASGKSNVLKALSFLTWFVKDSFSASRGSHLPFDRFNDEEALGTLPTRLSVHIGGLEDIGCAGDPKAPQCRYAYDVTFGAGAMPLVKREALHYWPSTAARKVRLFERDACGKVDAAKAFGLTGFRQALEKVLRPEVSVVSTLAQLKHPFAEWLWNAASKVATNILVTKLETSDDLMVRHYAANPKLVDAFNREIERIDLGIRSMQIFQGQNGPQATFVHHGLARPMPLTYQSEGTRQYLRIYPTLLYALENGGIAVIDELDATVHPFILPEILRWFYDPLRNPHNAQLWMSCHNASLLEDLTKEEVLFCSKDIQGRTEVYSLQNIQAVRRTDNYYRKYLGGAFGAVPHIG